MTPPRRPGPDHRPNRPPTLRVSQIGGETLREIGKLGPAGETLLSIRHHVTGRWSVILPYEPGGTYLPIVGSAGTLRDAYRQAERARRVQRHQPDRLLRHIDRQHKRLRAERRERRALQRQYDILATEHAHQTQRAEETIRQLSRRLKLISGQAISDDSLPYIGPDPEWEAMERRVRQNLESTLLAAEREKYRALQTEHTSLLARHATLTGRADEYRKQLGLPTSDQLSVPPRKPAPEVSTKSEEVPNVHVN